MKPKSNLRSFNVVSDFIVFNSQFVNFLAFGQIEPGYQPLNLIAVYQLEPLDTLSFDFSGIVQKDDSIFVIADKPWNSYIYHINFTADSWHITDKKAIFANEELDLEAIDYCDQAYYLTNEFAGSIYVLRNNSVESINIDFSTLGYKPKTWGNAHSVL